MPHSLTPAEARDSSALAAVSAWGELVPPPFACSWVPAGRESAWIHVVGELDIAAAAHLEGTLQECLEHARLLVLDLRELAFIDCAGVRCVVGASRRARLTGHRLVVLRGRASVDRVFTLTRSRHDIEIVDLDPVDDLAETLLRLTGAVATA